MFARFSIIFLLLAPWAGDLFCQSDFIIRFSDLNFNSEFERKTFEMIENREADLFRTLAAIDPDVTESIFREFQKDLSNAFRDINNRKFNIAGDEKKVLFLYQYVNTKKLNRYQEKTLFPHLFVNGTFNCLTASAYYGFLMDSLNIPYEFREATSHVLPVAYPSGLQIQIETTDRVSGISYYDEELRENIVKVLKKAGYISKEDIRKNTTDELFNRFYLPETSIGMKEITGLHYMNDALYLLQVKQLDEAYIQIKKAYYLYPSEKMGALLKLIFIDRLLSTYPDPQATGTN